MKLSLPRPAGTGLRATLLGGALILMTLVSGCSVPEGYGTPEPRALYAHGPAAANECHVCHQLVGKGATRRISRTLVTGFESLCIGCHDDKDGEFAAGLGLVSHEPAGEGMCVKCHDPHRSSLRYMLKGKSPLDLCMSCHGEEESVGVPADEIHLEEPERSCVDCHNPHFGKTSSLLKADFDEWQLYE